MAALLALSAAVCWGTADFLAGTQARRLPLLEVALVSQVTGLVGLGIVVWLRAAPAPPSDLVGIGIATGVISLVAICTLYLALARGDMARVAPIFGTAAAVPVIAGLIGGERPSPLQAIGIVAAIGGVMLVSRERPAGTRERARTGAILLAIFTALCLGSATLGIKRVSEYDPYWAVLLIRITAVSLLVLAAPLVSRRWPGIRPCAAVPLVAVGVLDVGANVLFGIATTKGLLILVAVLATVFPAVTVILALLLLGERLDRLQAIGVLATLAGSAALTAG